MKKFILLLSTILLPTLTGCTYYRVNADEIAFNTVHPNENQHDIQYLETVNVPYEVLGTVVVSTERRNSMEEVVEKMKRQISVLGGDAVTNIVQIDEPSAIKRIRTKYKGTVIVFKNKSDAPAPAANPAEAAPQSPSSGEENLK